MREVINRILNIAIKVDHSHNSIGSFCFDGVDVLCDTHLDDLFSGDVLLGECFFGIWHLWQLLFWPEQLLLYGETYIARGLTGLEEHWYRFEVVQDLLLANCVAEDFECLWAQCTNHVFFVYFWVSGRVGYVHTATEINHYDHTFNRFFLLLGLALGRPVLDKTLFDAFFVGFSAIQASFPCEEDSTELAIDGIGFWVDSVCIFFVEILDGEAEGVRDEPLGLFHQVLPIVLQEVHWYFLYIFSNLNGSQDGLLDTKDRA